MGKSAHCTSRQKKGKQDIYFFALGLLICNVFYQIKHETAERPGGLQHSSTAGFISASVSKVIIPPDVLRPPLLQGFQA